MRQLFAWLLWGALGAGALFALGEEPPERAHHAQTWLTQGATDAGVATPVQAHRADLRAPERTLPESTERRTVGVRTPSRVHARVARPRDVRRRGRPWARHGAHVPRMGDEPPPA